MLTRRLADRKSIGEEVVGSACDVESACVAQIRASNPHLETMKRSSERENYLKPSSFYRGVLSLRSLPTLTGRHSLSRGSVCSRGLASSIHRRIHSFNQSTTRSQTSILTCSARVDSLSPPRSSSSLTTYGLVLRPQTGSTIFNLIRTTTPYVNDGDRTTVPREESVREWVK